jgi:hypothetical protein
VRALAAHSMPKHPPCLAPGSDVRLCWTTIASADRRRVLLQVGCRDEASLRSVVILDFGAAEPAGSTTFRKSEVTFRKSDRRSAAGCSILGSVEG